jgi:hypothetical protein
MSNSWARTLPEISSLSQVCELSADELLSCKLTDSGSTIISCSCQLLKSSLEDIPCLTHDCYTAFVMYSRAVFITVSHLKAVFLLPNSRFI